MRTGNTGRSMMTVGLSPGRPPVIYRQFGTGPGLVILHGMMETSADHVELAESLSSHFTVYVPDRRGFGESSRLGFAEDLDAETQDLMQLLDFTGARLVMGVSIGALICLQTLTATSQIDAAVIFEPPLSIDGSAPMNWIPEAKRRLALDDRIGAMVTAMVGAEMGPPFLAKLPFWLLKLITRAFAAIGGSNGPAPFVDLAPSLAHDADIVINAADTIGQYRTIKARTLLLGGSTSPRYFGYALTQLAAAIPGAELRVVEGRDHQVTGNANRGGDPSVVAGIVSAFLMPHAGKAR